VADPKRTPCFHWILNQSKDAKNLVAFDSSDEDGRKAFFTLSLSTGDISGPLYGRDDADIVSVVVDTQCVVSINGIADLESFNIWIGNEQARSSETLAYWEVQIGKNDYSSAPVLLIHSKADEVVPVAQSERKQEFVIGGN